MSAAPLKKIFDFLKQTVFDFSEDSCTRMAGALAYFTVFALPPVAVLLILILGFAYQVTGQGNEQAARAAFQEQIEMFVGEKAAAEVAAIIKNAGLTGGWLQWALGIAGVLVSATGVVATLQDTLNEVWGVQPDPDKSGVLDFLLKRVFSLGMILGLGFILLVSTLLTSWLNKYVGGGGTATSLALSFLIVWGLFAAIFKYLPDVVISWKDALIGGGVTAVLFLVGKAAIDLYLANSKLESQFGAAAALAILLAWIYYSSLILLYGAEFTQLWSRRYGSGFVPEPGAIRLSRRQEISRNDASSQ